MWLQSVVADEVQKVGLGVGGGREVGAGLAEQVSVLEWQIAALRDMEGRELSGVFGGFGAYDDEEQAKGWFKERFGESVESVLRCTTLFYWPIWQLR